MVNGAIEKPGGVSVAAVVLGLMSLFGLLCVAVSILTMFLTRNPIVPNIASVRIIFAAFNLLMLVFVAWCFWTVVGLFQFKPWARYSIIVIGVLDFVFFTLLSAVMVAAHTSPVIAGMDVHPNTGMPFSMGVMMLGLAAFYVVLALIGVWWVVYFSLRHVRLAFAVEQPPGLTP
jgi:hypothetical protein